MGKTKNDFFLVHPENQDFVAGKAKAPAKRSTRGSSNIMGVFAVLMVVVAGALIAWTGILWNNYTVLTNQGQTTTGTIVEKRSAEGEASISYFFGYEFQANGQTYRGETRIPEVTYVNTEEQTPIEVLYLPSDPTRSDLTNYIQRPIPLLVVAVVFSLLALLMVLGALEFRRRSAVLRENGQVVRGDILRVEREDDDGAVSYNIDYAFQEPTTGETLTGKHSIPAKLFGRNRPTPGMTVAVYYADRRAHELL